MAEEQLTIEEKELALEEFDSAVDDMLDWDASISYDMPSWANGYFIGRGFSPEEADELCGHLETLDDIL